ncbi:MAG: type II toxin-antitoxin system HipA family toxin, partial [Deltaproteobacteria bacterium]|nr:type II toxin-antitoxin system HipA family toxin [Deltaproteobacteria bacterium]
GTLAVRERVIYFEYATSFLNTKLELSPFKLPLRSGVFRCADRVFDGIWGVFNDSLPDGWGRLLLDRKLMSLGKSPKDLTPLDRLSYVGTRGMGALSYEPDISDQKSLLQTDLDQIAGECYRFQNDGEETFIDELLTLNGSSAGARPKILIRLDSGEDWLIKFRSSSDLKDAGSIEYAYHLMAIEAGLQVPKARLFESKTCSGYFGVKRFDHINDQVIHMHTASGLLHADYRIPSLDYETLMKATAWLTKDVRECEKLFRIAVFNVMAYNRDDHTKNFSFLMDANGSWSLAPAYDLTFSAGPMGEHCATVMGEGKKPTQAHLLRLAKVAQITDTKASEIIEQTQNSISKWAEFAQAAGVTAGSLRLISSKLLSSQ